MKVSASQMFWLMFIALTSLSLWYVISPTVKIADQGAWMSAVVATVLGLFFSYVIQQLGLLFPHQTIFEYSRTLLGNALGQIVSIQYLCMLCVTSAIQLRGTSDLIHRVLFDKTPIFVLVALIMFLVVYLTFRGGIEGIGRFGELVGPVILITILITWFLDLPNAKWHALSPLVSDSGVRGILQGSTPFASAFGVSLGFLVFIPLMVTPKKSIMAGTLGLLSASVLVIWCMLMTIVTFGYELSGRLVDPYFSLVRFVSLFEFVRNIDSVVVFIIVFGAFTAVSLYFFITCYGVAKWLNMKAWRRTIWFVAPLECIIALLPSSDTASWFWYPQHVWLTYIFPFDIICLPLLLLCIAKMKVWTASSNR
ncbi:GerAB/ArcD/ProY family transporter [Alicyclobacillus fastidiosus]|uniref:Endospore germination permease n=1 Tax=Alicyclobacillus fastidiosus TaxID=392011 RepID=A0ABV5AJZ9_9BACL|nr:endospore germination permease [Alicyclobacillus fastidiosus]WEH11046.1 endospore germination permease [Alicyclobacillus fastidiosus]